MLCFSLPGPGDSRVDTGGSFVNSCASTVTAFCKDGCRNGGACIASNVCACPQGFTGPSCETGKILIEFIVKEIQEGCWR